MRARTIPLRGRIKRKALLRMRALVGYQNKEYILLLLLPTSAQVQFLL